jgi:CheY-like chemotaxis protein
MVDARKALSKDLVLKFLLSVVLLTFAITRIFFYKAIGQRMDLVFFTLVLSVFLLWMFPWRELWERVSGLSVGGVELSLQKPSVQAAIGNLSIAEEQLKVTGSSSEEVRDRLRRQLESLQSELKIVRDSRVLWIDDYPHQILGERRLLRALGIDVTPARSSERAKEILEEDNDFDLIITDTVRGSTRTHEGVDFVVNLRTEETDERIKHLPVIFYAAYPLETLMRVVHPARELPPEPKISISIDDLIPKVIKSLSEERLNPITVSATKTPSF